MKGWVYIITNKAMPNLVKVGFSTKDPELRANELHTTGVPHRYVVEYDALVNEPRDVEQKTHVLLKAYHENKEWFRCDISTAIIAIRQAANGSIILESNKEDFSKADEQGVANAQCNLGVIYQNGEGVIKDVQKAVEWHRKFAEQGNIYREAVKYYEQKEYIKALPLLKQVADCGNTDAQSYLGLMYEFGYGVTNDYQKAVEWYRKAAEQRNAYAQWRLGGMYEHGEGVTKDRQKAIEWYRKSAEQGNANAQCNLGFMYQYGEGVAKDYQKAVEWYRKAAEQGDVYAQWRLGGMYEHGEGVTKDYQKAAEWYRKSAKQGNSYGQNNLNNLIANIYREAVKYYEQKEYSKALPLFKQVADCGNTDAQSYLGLMYEYGYGVPKKNQKAVEWYSKAAEQGNAYAQNKLGDMYLNGYGVTKDRQKAMEWYRKAAEQGHAQAQANLERMNGLFSRLFN